MSAAKHDPGLDGLSSVVLEALCVRARFAWPHHIPPPTDAQVDEDQKIMRRGLIQERRGEHATRRPA